MTKRVRKTISMPAKDLKLVLATLRAPENADRQGMGCMFDGAGYCCLGLMQQCKSGGIEVYNPEVVALGDNPEFRGFPSPAWLGQVGWHFKDQDGQSTVNPWLPTLEISASGANDSGNYTFADIADAIEACATTY